MGGEENALRDLAESTIDKIAEKELLKTIFIRLINYSKEFNHTRRVAYRSEFTDVQWRLIEKLSSALDIQGKQTTGKDAQFGRLLKFTKKGKETEQGVELVHEALITSWDTYRDWINEVRSFKKVHDVVITKTKAYNVSDKKRSFLLMGAELDESKSLLGREYGDFLSESEKNYLLESKKFEKDESRKQSQMIRGLKFLTSVLIGLLILSGYFWLEADKGKEKTLELLDKSTKIAVEIVEEDNSSLAIKTFKFVVNELNSSSGLRTQRILATAKFGIGLMEQRVGNYSQAIREYQYLYLEKNLHLGEDVLLISSRF